MAKVVHTFVRMDFVESDGSRGHEEFEFKQDVKVTALSAVRKEVEEP